MTEMSRCSDSMSESSRLEGLDLWRSVAVCGMCLYHLLYDLAEFDLIPMEMLYSMPALVFRAVVGGSFVLLAGISSRFSRNNVRRGVVTLCAGLLVMAVTMAVGSPVIFGVLQVLGLCMVFYGVAGECIGRIPEKITPFLYAVLYLLTLFWTQRVTVDVNWLFPLGFVSEDFYSSDFYPLFPWLFLFLFGTWLGGIVKQKYSTNTIHFPAVLTWPGRHSLIIYLLHQPVLFGLCRLIAIK